MWFRNLTLYSFSDMPGIDGLNEALARQRYAPCTDVQHESSGFVAPRGEDASLVFAVDKHLMIALCVEKKVLPAPVVRDELAKRLAEVEKNQGFKPGRKQKAEIREDVTDALLSQAFSVRRTVRAWIDMDARLIALDTASQTAADRFVTHLIRAFESDIGLRKLQTVKSAVVAMTAWVADEPPFAFTIDDDTTFAGNNGGAVTYSKVSIEQEDVTRQIESGKYVTRLALTHAERLSFVFSSGFVLRRIAPLDVLKEPGGKDEPSAAADFLLLAATLASLVRALIDSLDGIATAADLADEPDTGEADTADVDATGEPAQDGVEPPPAYVYDDSLCEQAKTIVIGHRRASISLVQRHLRIGYNRAAAILEELEKAGIVSPMTTGSERRVLVSGVK
ncbi:recombination-associated protein RdgC [Paraburkholderia sp. C35]|uniref:recombination-associated protein RdgC n=1 Tax=Paraburkholderia sp. C35 TaxID=2126993 RepID=UPI000D6884E8|nr:recombination-associated protein RdgC [Paraburkholderia sp. C35]